MKDFTTQQTAFLVLGVGAVGFAVYAYVSNKRAAAVKAPPDPKPVGNDANTYPPSEKTSGGRITTAKVQEYLNYLGTVPKIVVNGNNGPATVKAVRELQASFGLPQTGLVDAATADMIASVEVA